VSIYSVTQIVYSFSFSVGSAAGMAFPNQDGNGLTAMQSYLQTVATAVLENPEIRLLIGLEWAPVWGPVVFANDTTGATVRADNTMACYYNKAQNLFVVAVAGTNPNSPLDWFGEDFDVHTKVPWTTVSGPNAGTGNISAGSSSGLQILLKMTDSTGNTMLAALANYITEHKVPEATIAVGGHSLGGALSPCLALYMYDNAGTLGLGGKQLSVFATAGPTPGDAGWAQTYEGLIAAGSITYSSVFSTQDVIPLAWQPIDLGSVPTLYAMIPANDFTGSLVAVAALTALDSSYQNTYTQVTTNHTPMHALFNAEVDVAVAGKLQNIHLVLPGSLQQYAATLIDVARFVAQAAVQHTSGYPPLLGIADFAKHYAKIVAANKPATAISTDPVKAAVLKATGIDLDRVPAAKK
jgi:hypothetical protein